MKIRAAILATGVLAIACRSGPAPTPPPAEAAPAGPLVFVSNEDSGDVTVIDPTTDAVVRTLFVGKRPRGLKASRDGSTLYVAVSGSPKAPPGVDESTLPPPDRDADGIAELDLRTGRLVKTHES